MGLRNVGVSVAVALGIVVPLGIAAAVALVAAECSPLDSAAAAAPLVGTIESAQRTNQVNVGIRVEFADAVSPSTQAGGTITALASGPDRMLPPALASWMSTGRAWWPMWPVAPLPALRT